MRRMNIGIVGYDQVTALDIIGPMEAFDAANRIQDRRAEPGRAPVFGGVRFGDAGAGLA
jgi:putative intracellular protease/amidase